MTGTNRLPVLVTGGAGYIGSHAVLALLDAGWPVVVIDNLVTGFRWAVAGRCRLRRGRHRRRSAGRAALIARARDRRDHAFRRLGGGAGIGRATRSNIIATTPSTSRALIESAVPGGVRHFIFSSTAATYGIPDKVPVAEGAPTVPINPYGMSKLMTERMLRDVAAAHPLNYCALRYFNVAGADPQGRSGQSTAGATHLIKIAVEAATGKRGHVDVLRHRLRHARTAPGCATISMSAISPPRMSHALERLIAEPDGEP